jgi:hypothetical protein
MVPIHLSADRPSSAILEAEAMLLERDGPYHVGDLYFASQSDAETVRRIEAERIVRGNDRRGALTCAFCGETIIGQVVVVIAMRSVHPKCAARFDAWVAGHLAENDPRFNTVTHSTVVIWEGEPTTWGSLSQNEKQSCEFDADGRLVGGSPI